LSEAFPGHLGLRPGELLAGYRLEVQIGAGGMAAVFRARDERLGRPVALKIMMPALAADSAYRRRFIAESRAAALVDDPHIIPIYEASEAEGVLFIAMRFVQGGDLRRVLEKEGALAPIRAAEFISPVASALDAAHAAGLVHRDVKPANILVDARAGRPDHVYLSDFGVVKGASASVSLTGADYLGTPHYSAPEQIDGLAVDGRADQYALACVAYQLLTGAVPFERDHSTAVLLAHLSAPPPSLLAQRPDLPGAVDQVVAKAMAKPPGNRYQSCGDFADALREALGLTPYHPRSSSSGPVQPAPSFPPSDLPPLAAAATETAPPRPVPIQKTAAPAAEAAAGSVSGAGAADVVEMAEEAAIDRPDGADGDIAGDALAPMAVHEDVSVVPDAAPDAVPAAATGEVAEMPAAVAITRPDRPEGESDGGTTTVRVRHRRLALVALVCALLGAAVAVPFLMRSPAASPRAPSSPEPATSSRPVSFSRVALDLPSGYRNGFVSSLAFSPTGGTLAIAHRAGEICLWDLASRGCTDALAGAWAVAFSPNGKTLATGDATTGAYADDVINGVIRLWNVATGKLIATFADPSSQGALSLVFSPDGKTLAVGDRDGAAYLWNVATGKLIHAALIDPSSRGINEVAFSPDGTTLAVSDVNGCIYLWNVATGKLITTLVDPSSQGVDAAVFSPDGKTLAAADDNGHIYLWNAVTWKRTAAFKDPDSRGADSVAFSPDGKTLAAGDVNGCTYVWSVATGKLVHAPLIDPDSEGINAVLFSPSGKTLATGDENGDVYVW
jgi:sugar lactone lactonase YvrE